MKYINEWICWWYGHKPNMLQYTYGIRDGKGYFERTCLRCNEKVPK